MNDARFAPNSPLGVAGTDSSPFGCDSIRSKREAGAWGVPCWTGVFGVDRTGNLWNNSTMFHSSSNNTMHIQALWMYKQTKNVIDKKHTKPKNLIDENTPNQKLQLKTQ